MEDFTILCHKCSGVLMRPKANADHLYSCGCISGWIRGFEPHLTIEEAEKKQVEFTKSRDKWITQRSV